MSDIRNPLKRLPVAATMSLTWRGEDSPYFLRSKRWFFGVGWGGEETSILSSIHQDFPGGPAVRNQAAMQGTWV